MTQEIPPEFEYSYPVVEETLPGDVGSDTPLGPGEDACPFREHTVTVRRDEAEALIDEIREVIEAYSPTGVERLVLGAEEYTTVDAYARYASETTDKLTDASAQTFIKASEIIVVPGSMIHPADHSEVTRDKHLAGEYDPSDTPISFRLERVSEPHPGEIESVEWSDSEVARMDTHRLTEQVTQQLAQAVVDSGSVGHHRVVLDDGTDERMAIDFHIHPLESDTTDEAIRSEVQLHAHRLIGEWRAPE